MKYIQLKSGQKFNKLTVIRLNNKKIFFTKNGKTYNKEYYLCKCDCGKEKVVQKSELMNNYVKSCGCLMKGNIIHNLYYTRQHVIWLNMKDRCYNKNSKVYKYYGGRGITICEDWKNDFKSFYDWSMSNGYQDNLTIDRINTNGNYEPSNCRWVDIKTQQRNKRNNHLITNNGETHCIGEWAEILNIKYLTLFNRLKKYNFNVDKSFNMQVRKYNIK